MTNDKPTEQDFKNFWSVFQAEQQRRKKNKTIPPEIYEQQQTATNEEPHE